MLSLLNSPPPIPFLPFQQGSYNGVSSSGGGWGATIEEGRERQVTSYLRQWTQLIRLHRPGVLKNVCTGKTMAAHAV